MLDAIVIDLDTPPAIVVQADVAAQVGKLVNLDADLGLNLAKLLVVDVDAVVK